MPVSFNLPSDFGFDPLGLATVPENFERFKESEVYHCRWAMLAVVRPPPCTPSRLLACC